MRMLLAGLVALLLGLPVAGQANFQLSLSANAREGVLFLVETKGTYRLELSSPIALTVERKSGPSHWEPLADNYDGPTVGKDLEVDLVPGRTYRLSPAAPVAQTVLVTVRSLGFSGLKTELQKSLSGALAQTTVLKRRWSSPVPEDTVAARTVLDSLGTAWTVLLSADRRRVQLWSPEKQSPVGEVLPVPVAFAEAGLAEVSLTTSPEGRLLLLLQTPAGRTGTRLYSWTGKAWAAEPLPGPDWVAPFTWTSGATLWGVDGTTLVGSRWTTSGWTPLAAGLSMTVPPGPSWKLVEASGTLFLTVAGESGGVYRRSPTGNWQTLALGTAAGPAVLAGTFEQSLSLLSLAEGQSVVRTWLASGWQVSLPDGRPSALSTGGSLLFGWEAGSTTARLLQFDGVTWRTPLPLEGIAPAGRAPWVPEFLAPTGRSPSGTLVLFRPGPGARLDGYDLP